MANKYEDITTAMSVLTGYIEGKNKALDTGDVEYKQIYDQDAGGYRLVPKKSLIGQTYQTGPVEKEEPFDLTASLDEISNTLDRFYTSGPVWKSEKENFLKFKGSLSALDEDAQKTAIKEYRKKMSENYADPEYVKTRTDKIQFDAEATALGYDTGEEYKLVSEYEDYGSQIFLGTLSSVVKSENGEKYAQIFRDAGYLGENDDISKLDFNKTFDLVTADGVDGTFDEVLQKVEKIALESEDKLVLNTIAQWESLSNVGLGMLNTAKTSNLGDNENIASNYRTQMKDALKATYEIPGTEEAPGTEKKYFTLSENDKNNNDLKTWFENNFSESQWNNIKAGAQVQFELNNQQIAELQKFINFEDKEKAAGALSTEKRKLSFTAEQAEDADIKKVFKDLGISKALKEGNITVDLSDEEMRKLTAIGITEGWPEEDEEESLKYDKAQLKTVLENLNIPQNTKIAGKPLNINEITDDQAESLNETIIQKSKSSRPANKYHRANAQQHIKNANSIFKEANMDASLEGIIDNTIENLITGMTKDEIKARHRQYFKQLKLGIENYFEASDSGIDAKVFIGYPEVAEAIHNKSEDVKGFMEVIKNQDIKIIDGATEIEIDAWISDNYISNNKFETPSNPKNNVTISVNGQEFEIPKDRVLTELLNTYKKSYENFSTGTTEERSNQLDNLFLYYGMGPDKLGRKPVLFFFETVPDPKNYTLEDIK